MTENSLAIFKGIQIRRHYDDQVGFWHFSVVGIVQAMLQQPDCQAACNNLEDLKHRLKKRVVSRLQFVTD